jgi:hypothetical protein
MQQIFHQCAEGVAVDALVCVERGDERCVDSFEGQIHGVPTSYPDNASESGQQQVMGR